MSKGGIGIGSASIVLVFAVLCLTIFSLISLTSATGDKALVDAEIDLVQAYYHADTKAELILDSILQTASQIPDNILGVDITVTQAADGKSAEIEFTCPVSPRKELLVWLTIREGKLDIRRWRLQDAVIWEFDPSLPIWTGNPLWLG